MFSNKEIINMAAYPFTIAALLIVLARLFKPQGLFNYLILFIVIYAPLESFVKNKNLLSKEWLLKTFKLLLLLSFFYLIINWLGTYGLVGLIIIVLGFATYRIYKGRVYFMQGMRSIEEKLFGKPLDKKEWRNKK